MRLAFVILLALPLLAKATAYTSSQSGPWSSASTWGGAGVPTSGDTVSIGAHTVNVDADVSIGTSPNDTTTKAINITSGSGVLVVTNGVTLTVKGSIGHVNGSTHRQLAGSTVIFDNSASGGSPVYNFSNGGFSKISLLGSQGSSATIQAISGQTFTMAPPWDAVTMTYAVVRRCSGLSPGSSLNGDLSITDSLFDACDRFNPTLTSGTRSFVLNRNTFTNGTHATENVNINWNVAKTSGTRQIVGNTFHKILTYNSKAFTVVSNYIGGGFQALASTTWDAFRLNFVKQDGGLNGGNGARIPYSIERNYFVVENGTGNPHFLAPTALLSVDTSVAQCVFESQTPDLVDLGDSTLINNGSTSGGFKIVGKNNVVLPSGYSGATVASGTLLTCFNENSAISEWYRNTGSLDSGAHPGGKLAMFDVAEGSNGGSGQVAALKSNLGWARSASQNYLAMRVQGTVKDIITAAGADYNWLHNSTAGDNLRGYEDRAGSGDLWTAGNAVAAGVDDHQGSGDPQFYDSTRNMATWATARGYGSTYANALSALQENPSRVGDLISYVFEGFRPGNSATRNAAHDGGCVGAANYYKASRKFGLVNSYRSTLSTFGL